MAEIKAGQYVTDGTSVFILDDVRDGNRVGDIVFRPVLHAGYIKANGATVKASEYPRLLKFAQDNNLLISASEYSSNCAKYVYDANADTLRVPNAQGRVLEGSSDQPKTLQPGLPNITGRNATFSYFTESGEGKKNGAEALQGTFNNNTKATTTNTTGSGFFNTFWDLDASKSNAIYGAASTVQPPAIALIPQIKY